MFRQLEARGGRAALVDELFGGLVVLASWGLGWPAQAATYYVDRLHPAASDANPGSEAQPWLTIQHAADTLVAGDTVLVKAGTYPEQVTVASAGAAGQEIVFAAYPGHTVTVDGSTLALGEYEGLFQMVGASYVRVRGFHVTNTGPFGTNTGIQVDPGDHIVIEGNHTSFTASSGILIWSSSDVLVDGNEVDHPMTTGDQSRNECISVGRSTRFEVRNNHVHDNPEQRGEGICLKDGSTFGSAHHNQVHHVPNVGIYLDAWTEHTHDIAVYSNRVRNVEGNGIAFASEQGGLLDSLKIYNNLIHDNGIAGIYAINCCSPPPSHPVQNVEIHSNTIYRNGYGPVGWGPGIGIENPEATGIVIRNNVLSQNNADQIYPAVPGNITASYNLIDGDSAFTGTNPVFGSPLFVDAAAANFHLQRVSPGIDSGTPLGAPPRDCDGVKRPQDGNDDGTAAFDIGAYELPPSDYIFGDGFELRP